MAPPKKEPEPVIRNTGGQVDDMVMALIDSANDKDKSVKGVVSSSLHELGCKQPALVLSSCLNYLVKHAKLPTQHCVVILKCMGSIIKDTLDQIDQTLAKAVVKQAAAEMTQTKEVVPEWQNAASGVLVAIGGRYIHEVMEDLTEKFQPGIMPHFFVVETMANLATSNVYGMVPFLKGALGTMLPMLGMAKQDNMRWIISLALAKFCEAILDYVANIEKAPDPAVTTEFYSAEVDSAFDVLFSVWLHSRDSKLRMQVLEAIGQMSHVMSVSKLEEQLPKILHGILNLYKKSSEAYYVTHGLCEVLDAASKREAAVAQQTEMLLNALFPHICHPVDYSLPMTVKNHNELLRCFWCLVPGSSLLVVMFLLEKLENTNEKIRVGVLSILRHIINARSEELADKQDVILAGLRKILTDPNNKVKKALAQTIIAMAHHGYLELEGGQQMIEFIVAQCAFTTPEPSSKRPLEPDYVSNEALRSMCDNCLQLLTTTVDNMDGVLWPYLLEFVLPQKYTDAQTTLCQCIAHIASKKREAKDEDYMIDFETQVNIPKPPALLARLLVLCGLPVKSNKRGLHVLMTLQSLAPIIHENLVEMWDTVIPKLSKHLKDHQDMNDWSQSSWEDLVLKFVSKSLEHVADEDWVCSLGDAMAQQLPLYENLHEEKNFLYKCLGIIMRISSKKEFVNKHLDTIFTTVKHSDQLEREGCAIAVGFTAASHLDAVIVKLEAVAKNKVDGNRKSGLFNFIKDLGSGSDLDEKVKATLMLCYGYVALYAPPTLIISRMEAVILKSINPHFSHIKDQEVKLNLIRAVDLIGKAMHPDHLMTKHTFADRSALLHHLEDFIKMESPTHLSSEVRALALEAAATLVKLDPKLNEAEQLDLIKIALDNVMALPEDGALSSKKSKDENCDDVAEVMQILQKTLSALEQLLMDVLIKDVTPDQLQMICNMLHPWRSSLKETERVRALHLTQRLYCYYMENVDVVAEESFSLENARNGIILDHVNMVEIVTKKLNSKIKTLMKELHQKDARIKELEATLHQKQTDVCSGCDIDFWWDSDEKTEEKTGTSFTILGLCLGRMVPRCTDPNTEVRKAAIGCIHTLLRITLKYLGRDPGSSDEMIDALPTIQDRLIRGDLSPNTMFSIVSDLAKILSKKIPVDQLMPFLEALFEGLLDAQSQSSSGSCVVLNAVLKARGPEVHSQVAYILACLQQKLLQMEHPQAKTGTYRAIRTLTSHHMLPALDALFDRQLPVFPETVETWQTFSQDPVLTASIMDHALEQLKRTLPYEEKQDSRNKEKSIKYAMHLPLAITIALSELCTGEEAPVNANFARLLSAMMTQVASTVGARPPQPLMPKDESMRREQKEARRAAPSANKLLPIEISIEGLRQVIKAAKCPDMEKELNDEDVWKRLCSEEDFAEAFSVIAKCLADYRPQCIAKLITHLNPILSSVYDPQRIMAAAVFAQLINDKCAGDMDLVEMLVNGLLGRLVDSNRQVRRLCIRGLGNVANAGSEQVSKFSTTVLSAMMAGMDDKEDIDDSITLEAMGGLSKVLAEIDESHIRPILINISLRIRPCFEKNNESVRAVAIGLFGDLARFGDGPSKEPFLEQIHTNFISLLLHLNDPCPDVRLACKRTLRNIGPLLGSNTINSMFQKHLLESANLLYGEFMNDLAKAINKDFSDKLNFYTMGNVSFFRSSWPEIRANAAMLVGFLLGNMSKEDAQSISKEHVCGALILQLKDSEPEVRVKAAEAMRWLYEI